MANDLTHNPIIIDDWSADIELAKSGVPFYIYKIKLLGASAGDDFFLHNSDPDVASGAQGVILYALTTQTNGYWVSDDLDFWFRDGVYIDKDVCTLATNDIVLIYQ